jgi:hypothetical protein
MSRSLSVFAVVAALTATTAMAETQWRIGANLASIHVAPQREFNQINPGLYLSYTFQAEKRFQYGFQAGAYVNSYSERTIYALSFADWHVANLGSAEIRMGGFTGFFEYPVLSETVRSRGWPTMGDYLLAIGPSLKFRMRSGLDFSIGFLPVPGKETKGVFTFQACIPFGGRH